MLDKLLKSMKDVLRGLNVRIKKHLGLCQAKGCRKKWTNNVTLTFSIGNIDRCLCNECTKRLYNILYGEEKSS